MKIFFTLFLFFFSLTESYSREFTLTLDKCDEDFFVDQFFDPEYGNGENVYVCNIPIDTIKPGRVINYYYQNQCPNGYKNLDIWNIDLIEQSIKACNTPSNASLSANKNHKNRLKWHRMKCPEETYVLLDLISFKGCKYN